MEKVEDIKKVLRRSGEVLCEGVGTYVEVLQSYIDLHKPSVLRGVDLSGRTLHGVDFYNINFVDCDLSGTVFRHCSFDEGYFMQCEMNGTIFHFCSLECCTFKEMVMRGVNFLSGTLRLTDFEDVTMEGAERDGMDGFYNVDIRNVAFTKSKLQRIKFEGFLYGVCFKESVIGKGNFCNATLSDCCLAWGSVENTDFQFTVIDNTWVSGVVFKDCRFNDASLLDDCIRGVNFDSCHFSSATMWWRTALVNTVGLPPLPYVCPQTGAFIGYKICGDSLITLSIPADAKRSSATTQKCRCDKADVIKIEDIKTGGEVEECWSDYDHNFKYKVGEMVSVPDYNDDRFVECGGGIHFFVDKDTAIQYKKNS